MGICHQITLPIGSMYGIYANIWGILMGSMLPYIPYMDPMGNIYVRREASAQPQSDTTYGFGLGIVALASVTNGGSGRPHPARTGNFEEFMVGLPSGGVTCGEHAELAVCSDAAESFYYVW